MTRVANRSRVRYQYPAMRLPASRLAIALLVLLAAAGMLVQAASVPHAHTGAHAGLFNQEHDLTLLAGLAGQGLPVEAMPLLATATVHASVPPFVPERPGRHATRSGDSRAPPSA